MSVARTLTLRTALRDAGRRLAAAGCETPRLDAELLLASVLGVDRAGLVMAAEEPLAPQDAQRFEALVERRRAREPIAYILGSKPFRRLSIAVDRRVLIPRPETELLVEVGLGLGHGASVLDVATGSGAVALALKDERPDLTVLGSDTDPRALALARENALRLGLEVAFHEADLLDGVPEGYDAVLANLPYVPDGADLPPEIAGYEPWQALFAGPDGLNAIKRLIAASGHVSLLGLEVGFDQADAVEGLLRAAGFTAVDRRRDLAGHERVVVGRR